MGSFSSFLKKRFVLVIVVSSLAIALGISVYYNATAALPPDSITGIVVHKKAGVDVDENGNQVPKYTIHIYLFNDDRINNHSAANETSYSVNKEDFDSARINDVIKGRIIPGPFKGFGILDVYQVIPAREVIEETIRREYPSINETQIT
jgi:hypothetical protein